MKIFAFRFRIIIEAETQNPGVKPVWVPAEAEKAIRAAKPGDEICFQPQSTLPLELSEWVFIWSCEPDLREKEMTLKIGLKSKDEEEKFAGLIFSKFKIIYTAGGVPLRNDNEILLIFRKGFWDLPKGKLEVGENMAECALREVEEETGLKSHRIGRKLSDTFHTYFEKGKWILKKTVWWLMPCEGNEVLIPQEKEEITGLKWYHAEQALKIRGNLIYPLIQEVIGEAAAEIQ